MAKRPPSRGTSGRSSGGITGKTVRTIHSGLFPDSLRALTIFNLFASFFILVSDVTVFNPVLSSSSSLFKSTSSRSFLTASAPIPASKASEPYSSFNSEYLSSETTSFFFKDVFFGSNTIQDSK